VCDGSFASAISTITPELIARLGAKWHGAHNKAAAANVMRSAVIALDMNGLAASYDELAAADKKVEMNVVARMLHSGQHAARQHRERTAALVRELFAQTPPDNDALRDVKLNVFMVEDGKPIMDPKKHPSSILYVPLRWGFFFQVNTSNFQCFTSFHTEPHL
jgi:hypothetical protein